MGGSRVFPCGRQGIPLWRGKTSLFEPPNQDKIHRRMKMSRNALQNQDKLCCRNNMSWNTTQIQDKFLRKKKMSRNAPQIQDKNSRKKKMSRNATQFQDKISSGEQTSSLEAAPLLLTNHNIQYHPISSLHTLGSDAAQIADSLLNAILNDTVVRRNADTIHCKDSCLN